MSKPKATSPVYLEIEGPRGQPVYLTAAPVNPALLRELCRARIAATLLAGDLATPDHRDRRYFGVDGVKTISGIRLHILAGDVAACMAVGLETKK